MLSFLRSREVEIVPKPNSLQLLEQFDKRADEFKKIDAFQPSEGSHRELITLKNWIGSQAAPGANSSTFYRLWKEVDGFSYRKNVDDLLRWNSDEIMNKLREVHALSARYDLWMSKLARNSIMISLALNVKCNQIAKDLLNLGLDPNSSYYFIRSMPLIVPATNIGSFDTLEELLKMGANPNIIPYAGGICPLEYAINIKNLDAFEALLEAGASFSLCNHRGIDLVAKAKSSGSQQIQDILGKYLPKYHEYEKYQTLPHTEDGLMFKNNLPEIHQVIRKRKIDLTSHCDSVNAKDSLGNTPLMVCAMMYSDYSNSRFPPYIDNRERYKQRDCDASDVDHLIKSKADLHAVNIFGETALSIASKVYGSYAMIILLVHVLFSKKPEELETVLIQCGRNRPTPKMIRHYYCQQSRCPDETLPPYQDALATDSKGKPSNALSHFIHSDPEVLEQFKNDQDLQKNNKTIPFEPDYQDDIPCSRIVSTLCYQ